MKGRIAVIAGDGIGPDIMKEALAVLERVEQRYGHEFAVTHYPRRWGCPRCAQHPLPAETLAGCQASDAVLLGSLGGPKWDRFPPLCARRRGSWDCVEGSPSSATSGPPSCTGNSPPPVHSRRRSSATV